jgi:hypothetical protein
MYRPILAMGLLAIATHAAPATAQQAPAEPSPTPTARPGDVFRIPYRLTDTNHYLVRVRLNGKGPFNFLVDSGAPALYIGTEAAKAIGLDPAEDDFWTPLDRLDIEGGATLSKLKARIEDPFQLVGMNALGLPGASIDGILGFTVLARFRLEFDPTSDRMTWTRIAHEPKEPFLPRALRTRKGPTAPAEVQAMQALGPMMKLMSVFVGKQPEVTVQSQGVLGVALEADSGGVRVAEVLGGSSAEAAGVHNGDRLVSINGQRLDTLDAAHRAMSKVTPGDTVTVVVRRDGDGGAADTTLSIRAAEGF